jgi:hypothetical protein
MGQGKVTWAIHAEAVGDVVDLVDVVKAAAHTDRIIPRATNSS